MQKLRDLLRLLREPETGCPWDRKQTFDSFKQYLVDEAKEVVEAIDKKDFNNVCEELGDTLFNLLFLVNLAEEQGLFTLEDVVEGVYTKMVTRHPHVFGEKKVATAEEAYQSFIEAKKASKKA